jgi:hypothetical protein
MSALPSAVTSARRMSVPAIIASAFGKLDVERRARLLGRLLGSVGPLALVVVGGGVFAKYLRNAGWLEVPIAFEDAARATSSQVHDLVRYVEQSDPHLVEGLLAELLQDGTTMTAAWRIGRGYHDQASPGLPRLEAGSVHQEARNERFERWYENAIDLPWPEIGRWMKNHERGTTSSSHS